MTDEQQRTKLQNKSLHKWCELLAVALDESGYDMREVVSLPIRPTKENVKENIVHAVMTALYPKIKSTKDLDTKQIQEVYNVTDRAISERFGVHVPWPSIDSMSRR